MVQHLWWGRNRGSFVGKTCWSVVDLRSSLGSLWWGAISSSQNSCSYPGGWFVNQSKASSKDPLCSQCPSLHFLSCHRLWSGLSRSLSIRGERTPGCPQQSCLGLSGLPFFGIKICLEPSEKGLFWTVCGEKNQLKKFFFLAQPCGMWDLSSPTRGEPVPSALDFQRSPNQNLKWEKSIKHIYPVFLLYYLEWSQTRSWEQLERVLQFCCTHSSLGRIKKPFQGRSEKLGHGREILGPATGIRKQNRVQAPYCGFCEKEQARFSTGWREWFQQVPGHRGCPCLSAAWPWSD